MLVKFRNTIFPPPPQFLLHRRAELSTNSKGTQSVPALYKAERSRKAVYTVRCLLLHRTAWQPTIFIPRYVLSGAHKIVGGALLYSILSLKYNSKHDTAYIVTTIITIWTRTSPAIIASYPHMLLSKVIILCYHSIYYHLTTRLFTNVNTLCNHPLLSPRVFIPCYHPIPVLSPHAIISFYLAVLSSSGITLGYHKRLLHHVIIPCYHPLLSSHDTVSA
jgi:hypothetical protein